MSRSMSKRLLAEFIGTCWLVLGGCGSAIMSAAFPALGIGFLGVAFAFGLTVLTMAYAIGPISGCHLNPAVTLGLVAARRFPARDLAGYVAAQLLGALAGAAIVYFIASGHDGFTLASGFASNGYGLHSPGGFSLAAAFLTEFALTAMFVLVILGATDKRAAAGFAPIAIGLALTLVHLVAIPVDNASVNPARSTSQAVFVGDWAVRQLWLFWVAPLLGGGAAGLAYALLEDRPTELESTGVRHAPGDAPT